MEEASNQNDEGQLDAQCFPNSSSVAWQCVAAYGEVLDEVLLDIAQSVHRRCHTNTDPGNGPPPVDQAARAVATPQGTPVEHLGGLLDVFGHVHDSVATDQIPCMHCGRMVVAGRFAIHLEKCLGKGRQASRRALRRDMAN